MISSEQLNDRFGVEGLRFGIGKGGLLKADIDTDACTGEIYLHGAHVTQFQPIGHQPVLWVSEKSLFTPGKAIRGGVPICFPWFGGLASDPTAPGHGWARLRQWDIDSVQVNPTAGVSVTMTTEIDAFRLLYEVTFGLALTMSLTVTLSDNSVVSASFEEALHTYLSVGNIGLVSISGLESAKYIDKVDKGSTKLAGEATIRFDGECDRVYLDTGTTCRLIDPEKNRMIEVAKSGSRNTVVWNPWIEKSSRMSDFGDDEWPKMVCIETANVGATAIELMPGQSHAMSTVISVFDGAQQL